MRWVKDSRWFLLTIPLSIGVFYAGVNLPPTSVYYKLESIDIPDTSVNEPIILRVERFIRREFNGEYFVTVRKKTSEGWEIVCEGNGGGSYRTDSSLPDPLELGWWSNNKDCNAMKEPGRYFVSTFWKIQTFLGWRATEPASSNVFVVSNSVD